MRVDGKASNFTTVVQFNIPLQATHVCLSISLCLFVYRFHWTYCNRKHRVHHNTITCLSKFLMQPTEVGKQIASYHIILYISLLDTSLTGIFMGFMGPWHGIPMRTRRTIVVRWKWEKTVWMAWWKWEMKTQQFFNCRPQQKPVSKKAGIEEKWSSVDWRTWELYWQYTRVFDIHCVSKKVPTFKLSVTLSNRNRFSKFLHCYKAH